jgi:hypothetical protein
MKIMVGLYAVGVCCQEVSLVGRHDDIQGYR